MKKRFFLGLLALFLPLLLTPSALRAQPRAALPASDIPQMIQTAQKSVVNIQTDRSFRIRPWKARTFLAKFFEDFFEGKEGEGRTIKCEGCGSGVIIDNSGYVITNEHVIQGAETIRVVLFDLQELPATVVGKNKKEDIALLRIENPKDLIPLALGDSDKIATAEDVYAIGTPYGYSQTVTKGIVSMPHRELKHGDEVIHKDVIQTDTSLNPGNSGGPLLNTQGEMIGMVRMGDWRARNIGFAIPINTIKAQLDDLKSNQKSFEQQNRFKARFGFMAEEKLEDGDTRLVLNEISPSSLASKIRLKEGDVLKRFHESSPSTVEDLLEAGDKVPVGSRIYMQVLRNKRSFFTYLEVKS